MHSITFISNVTNPNNVYQNIPEMKDYNVRFYKMDESDEKIIKQAADTEVLVVDAMAEIGDNIISAMPNLRLIQSEGVGYQGIDIESAKAHDVTVANNKGVNDTAVAETTVMLILACLKELTSGQQAVYDGRQIEVKRAAFGVVRELSECTVGLVGFGDIARAAAKMLSAFGTRVVYSNRTRYPSLEEEYNVQYVSLDALLEQSDFVSLHLAVCEETREIADTVFFSKMKKSAYLINTSRGDLVDNHALLNSLLNNEIAGAGLDVISPEPVEKDNILLDERIKNKLVLTPHIAGITSLTVKKIFKNIYANIISALNGEPPINIVS